jgi:putative oxidoreductase
MTTQPLPNPASPAPLGPAARLGNTAFATSVALLILRLALGWTFIYHGASHAFGAFGGSGIDGFAAILAKQPLPTFLSPHGWAYVASYGELLGGISVLLGLFARLGTLPIIATMIVAIINVHGPNGFSILAKGYEYNMNLIAMSIVILVAGPGIISVDAFLFRRGLWARGPQPLSNPVNRP